jgi:hypothetical protein
MNPMQTYVHTAVMDIVRRFEAQHSRDEIAQALERHVFQLRRDRPVPLNDAQMAADVKDIVQKAVDATQP